MEQINHTPGWGHFTGARQTTRDDTISREIGRQQHGKISREDRLIARRDRQITA